MAARYAGVRLFGECSSDAVAGTQLVVLAVKPQQMRGCGEGAGAAPSTVPGPVVLSIAAGIRLTDLGRWLNGYARLARAMPNTPALIGRGISGRVCRRRRSTRKAVLWSRRSSTPRVSRSGSTTKPRSTS
jgi:pyrroline-5-carboxylate reductase